MSQNPGKSERTPFKHDILDSILERLVSAWSTSKMNWLQNDWLFIDLCAGPGADNRNSPRILINHASQIVSGQTAHGRCGTAHVVLIEQNPTTFRQLIDNIPSYPWVQTINGDARDFRLPISRPKRPGFVFVDPNHVGDIPLTRSILASIKPFMCLMVTLGCNAGGIKRLPIDARKSNMAIIHDLKITLPRTQDLLLVRLEKDSSQWAYLFRLPMKWTSMFIGSVNSIRRQHNLQTRNISYRKQPDIFERELEILMLTAKEFEVKYG